MENGNKRRKREGTQKVENRTRVENESERGEK